MICLPPPSSLRLRSGKLGETPDGSVQTHICEVDGFNTFIDGLNIVLVGLTIVIVDLYADSHEAGPLPILLRSDQVLDLRDCSSCVPVCVLYYMSYHVRSA